MPKITVVLPVYNGAKFLKKSIDSVLNQSLSDFELLINDDCSIDGSLEIIKSYSDNRIKVFNSKTNKGIFGSINNLINESSSPHIHLWAQDDIMEDNCLEVCHSFHNKNPEVAFSFSTNYRIDESDTIIRGGLNDGKMIIVEPNDSIPLFLIYGCIPGNISTVTLKRDIVIKEGLFNSKLSFIGDFDMWVHLSSKYNIGKIAMRLVKIRNHRLQASRRDDMYFKKLIETSKLYEHQLHLIDKSYEKQAKKVIRWVHQPHFVMVGFSFLKRGDLKLFYRYMRQLLVFGNPVTLLIRTLSMYSVILIGKRRKYRSVFFAPFKKHIENFGNKI